MDHDYGHLHVPAQLTFLVTFFDDDWDELVHLRSWTNDDTSMRIKLHKFRLTRWEVMKGLTASYSEYKDAVLMAIEVVND